jgi:hypothetical protein
MFQGLIEAEGTSIFDSHEAVLGTVLYDENYMDEAARNPAKFPRTVVATVSGVAGSPTNDNPIPALFGAMAGSALRPRSREEWRSWLLDSEHVRICDRGVVARELLTSSYCLGLLNDLRLPPWMPVWRSQDLIFATCLARYRPDAWVGYLPGAVIHDRRERHSSDFETIVYRNARVTAGELLAALLKLIKVEHIIDGVTNSWEGVGRCLSTLCTSKAILEDALDTVATSVLKGRRESLLKLAGWDLPRFIRDDVLALLAGLDKALLHKSQLELRDIGDSRTSSLREFRASLQLYGDVLQCWGSVSVAFNSKHPTPVVWEELDRLNG